MTTRLIVVAAVLSLLAACGGGGGVPEGGGANPAEPVTPAAPAAPAGRLWHNNYALDFVDGTQVTPLDASASTLADPDNFAVPWPDGTQYLLTDYQPGRGQTLITVKETGSRRILFELAYSGYAAAPQPSPTRNDVVLMTLSASITEPADYAFIDLRTERFIERFAEANVSVDWLPDGRYLQLSTTGQIHVGTPGGAKTAAGTFDLQGRRLGAVRVNPQGTQFMVTLADTRGVVVKRDLWVANLDGSNAGRLTSTDITSYGHWSPDGRHIAFDVDTGSVCNGAGCIGTCEIWYVASTARNADPLPGFPGEAAAFQVRNQRGSTRQLGCEVLAWLP